VTLRESDPSVYLANRGRRFCDRFAIGRSLVLLVSGYNAGLATKSVAADELCEAAQQS